MTANQRKTAFRLTRVGNGPILTPRKDIPWENGAVLNTAAIHDGKLFHLFYRGITHTPVRNISCIGHAWSEDGIHFERDDEPILRHGLRPETTQGFEDPRIVKIDDLYHLCYVCWNNETVDIALATSPNLSDWTDHGVLFDHTQCGNNKNATLFPEKIDGQYALIHRPMGFKWGDDPAPLDMWMSTSDDLKTWKGHRRLLRARRGEVAWEYEKIGLGAPPIRIPEGWLMVYHAVAANMVYRLGLVLLDGNNPTRVLKRTDTPILEPEADWELKGDVTNVVFTCGAVLRGDTLMVYYGGADTVIGLAQGSVRKFLDS